MPVTRELLKPVKTSFIIFSFIVALLFNLIPFPFSHGNLFVLPDLVALLLLYWGMHQPRKVGVGTAFWLGLALDIADANVFGQHSLAYCLTTYVVASRRRQLAVFPLWQQALYMLGLLLLNQFIMQLVRKILGAPFIGWGYFVGCFIAALLWPLITRLLQHPQRKESPSEL
ncbi:rod shape-determining protein MreD [Parachitinimonas caeni]|uniref:Rod shape-determining protein MreD n=1 Tax=Parachitinimonas caeni TaxID=3031301 RepID=A0ABT7DYR3_9NEIS|nr:rod shape-determining protein MreD [Parachitinimonas caeni]MDK2124959.1 rod shape-determining protein MreD [Parachitinimonas caeni]